MARFAWAVGGATATLTLPHPLKFRSGSLGRVRTRYRSMALDQRTSVTELLTQTGADVVEGRLRFFTEPGALAAMIEDAANGALLTYEHNNGVVVSGLLLEDVGPLTEITPDADRYGFGEWERTLRLRHVGDGANLLDAPEAFDNVAWTKTDVTVTAQSTAGGNLAPDKTRTSERLEVATNNQNARVTQAEPMTGITAFSVYLHNATIGNDLTSIAIRDNAGSGGLHRVTVKLVSGATSVDSGSPLAHGSIPGPGGWWRFYVVVDASAFDGSPRVEIDINRQTVNAGDALHAWGASLTTLATGWTAGSALPAHVPNSKRVLWQLFPPVEL